MAEKKTEGMSTGGMVIIAVLIIAALFAGWAIANNNDTNDNPVSEAAQELTEDDQMSIETDNFEAEVSEQ